MNEIMDTEPRLDEDDGTFEPCCFGPCSGDVEEP
jgi:hypothetical protein